MTGIEKKTRKNRWFTFSNFKELFYNAVARRYGLHKKVFITGPWHECSSGDGKWWLIDVAMHPGINRKTGEEFFMVAYSDCDDYCGNKRCATIEEALDLYNAVVDGIDFSDLKRLGFEY